jgi:hypothetical protein
MQYCSIESKEMMHCLLDIWFLSFFVGGTNAFALHMLTMLTRRMIVVKRLGRKQSWPVFRAPGYRTEIQTRYLARTALIKPLHHGNPSCCLVQSRLIYWSWNRLTRLDPGVWKVTSIRPPINFQFIFYDAAAPSESGPRHYRGFTITLRCTTVGRTPLDEWSARHKDFYLTTRNTH